MAGHFYDREGNPQHIVIAKGTGKLRSATLADAKKNNWNPGSTTVLNLLAKPALESWLKNQVLDAVICNDWKPTKDTEEGKIKQWKGMILEQSNKIGMDAAKRGSEIHGALELYFKEGIIDEKERDYIEPAIKYLHETYSTTKFRSEVTFSCDGYGGCIDLIGYDNKYIDDIPIFISDFKTKKDKAFEKSMKTEDKLMQLASYVHAANTKMDGQVLHASNIFISIETPGLFKEECYTEEEIARGLEMFILLKDYWHLANNTGK